PSTVAELTAIEPPRPKVSPELPELPRSTNPGLSTVSSSVLVLSAWLVRVTFGAVMNTRWLLVPVTLYCAALVAPEQVTLVLPQVKTPALVMPTLVAAQVPVPSTIVPRSRSCTQVSVNGLTILALALAFWFGPTASAGVPESAS